MQYSAPRRYTALPLPPYAFLPGRDPHPTANPQGHGGIAPVPEERLRATEWARNTGYLFGCDLYNAAFFWEAHEAWEGCWKETPRDTDERRLLQGLIQTANARLKERMARPAAVQRLRGRALQLLEPLAARYGARPLCGLVLPPFLAATERAFDGGGGEYPPIVLMDIPAAGCTQVH